MVRIRLTRIGRKNRPLYRIAVFDGHTRRDGKYIERLGAYDPLVGAGVSKVKIDRDRLKFWISKGAQPTEALSKILKHCGVS